MEYLMMVWGEVKSVRLGGSAGLLRLALGCMVGVIEPEVTFSSPLTPHYPKCHYFGNERTLEAWSLEPSTRVLGFISIICKFMTATGPGWRSFEEGNVHYLLAIAVLTLHL
jgi:hypothetical protein